MSLKLKNKYHKINNYLISENNRLKTILNIIPNFFYWKNLRGEYLWVNKAAEKKLEEDYLITESIIGKNNYDIFSLKTAKKYSDQDQYVIQNQKSIQNEFSIKLPNGKILREISVKEPLYDEKEKIIGIVGYTVDITDYKKVKEELIITKEMEIANQIKLEFLLNMNHNMNVPIEGLLNTAKGLSKEISTEEGKEKVKNFISVNRTLLKILDEIVSYIKTNESLVIPYEKEFSLKDILSEIKDLITPALNSKQLKLIVKYDKNIPNKLLSDPLRIHFIVMNLLINAIKFSEKNEITLTLQLIKEEEKRGIIKIVVQDRGIGIAKDKQDKIFTPFFKFNPSTHPSYKKLTLGLWKVKELINDLEGEISLESKLGSGSIFTCFIPCIKPFIQNEERIASNSDLEELKFKNLLEEKLNFELPHEGLILVVEDNRLVQTVMKNKLENHNLKVDVVNCGVKAIKKIEQNSYDLIIMDINLPDIDGREVTRRIRNIEAKKKRIRATIVALTAHLDEEYKNEVIQAGMDGFYNKPITTIHLMYILNTLVLQRRIQQHIFK